MIFLSIVNIFGVKTGALIQNVFTAAKVSALLGLPRLASMFVGATRRQSPRISAPISGATRDSVRSTRFRWVSVGRS